MKRLGLKLFFEVRKMRTGCMVKSQVNVKEAQIM